MLTMECLNHSTKDDSKVFDDIFLNPKYRYKSCSTFYCLQNKFYSTIILSIADPI